MHRRYLALLIVGLLMLPGCLGGSSPGGDGVTEYEKATPNEDGVVSPGEIWFNLEREDIQHPLDVTSLRQEGDTLYLTYVSETRRKSTFAEEVGQVALVYKDYVNTTEDPATTLKVNVTYDFGDSRVEYEIEKQWAQTYLDGDATFREYVDKILDENGIPYEG